ncbi:Hypothetical predicted protein [Paramuricea clavata]|uniref:Uncharacterized protein n=1 Tax=Paramuricea clavata TaxID=317549 RepID=A0A6S7HZC4_PARCT|nr:Hypothetical predicted protein [Paramuricea clavata]
MTPVATLASLILLAQIMSINAVLTKPDATFGKQCPAGTGISRIISYYSSGHKDRAWAFFCRRDLKITNTCGWSGWLNWYEQELLFQCPTGVLTGVFSTHNNNYQDRRFRFRCCRTKRVCQYDCRWTGYVNTFKGLKNYVVPYGYFITGAKSHHDNRHEDRVWRFLICRFH